MILDAGLPHNLFNSERECFFPGSHIFTLRAWDPDEEDGYENLEFSMITVTDDFGVTTDGFVFTNITLDYETTTSYGPYDFK